MSGLDPVGAWTLRVALALLFGSAALHKLRDPARFHASVREHRLLPPAASAPLAALLVAGELCSAALLLLPRLDPAGSAGAAGLLSLYAAAIAVNLARGRRDLDCGCLGPRHQPLSPWLLARNGVLCAGALLLLLEPAQRDTTWIDALSLLGSVTALALLWNAAHRIGALGAATPRAAAGRSARWRP